MSTSELNYQDPNLLAGYLYEYRVSANVLCSGDGANAVRFLSQPGLGFRHGVAHQLSCGAAAVAEQLDDLAAAHGMGPSEAGGPSAYEATRLWWDCMRGFSNVLEARNPTTIREFAGTLCSVAEKQRELVSLANDGRLSERELTERVLHPDQP